MIRYSAILCNIWFTNLNNWELLTIPRSLTINPVTSYNTAFNLTPLIQHDPTNYCNMNARHTSHPVLSHGPGPMADFGPSPSALPISLRPQIICLEAWLFCAQRDASSVVEPWLNYGLEQSWYIYICYVYIYIDIICIIYNCIYMRYTY